MNNNKVFETEKIYTQHLGLALKPKDKTTKCRVAKVGAGVVILPDNGSDITASEVVKALGLKDVEPEPEAEEEKRMKIILESEYHERQFYVFLTNSQIKLLDWLDTYGFIDEWTWRKVENIEFEEI